MTELEGAVVTRALQVEALGPAPIYRCRLTRGEYEGWTREGIEEVMRGLKRKLVFEWEYDATRRTYCVVAYVADERSSPTWTVLGPPPVAERRKGGGGA